MSQPRRSLGPVIAYMLTLLGLLLAGIWLWRGMHRTPLTTDTGHRGLAHAVHTPSASEDLSATDRQQLEDVLRRQAPGHAP